MDRAGLTRILDTFDRFRVTGPVASAVFIDKYLKAAGKSCVRADGNETEHLDSAETFDCLIACGASGPVDTQAAAIALMHAGWPSSTINTPAWMAEMNLASQPESCEHDQWYSPAPMQNRFTIAERDVVAEVTRLIKEQRVRRLTQVTA